MAKFKDNNHREWTLSIDVPLAREVRSRTGANLLDLQAGFNEIAADPILFVDVLWVLVEEEAGRRDVTDVDFGRALAGEAIEDACDALIQALLDFFPPRQREMLTSMQTAAARLQTILAGQVNVHLPQALDALELLTSGGPSPGCAASPDSPPAAE